MTNQEVRVWYRRKVAKIPELDRQWKSDGASAELRARRAWQIRHDARLQARDMMEHSAEVELLRERDRQTYGNPDGPTFDQLVASFKKAGLTDDDVFERIISGATTANADVDRHVDDGKRP